MSSVQVHQSASSSSIAAPLDAGLNADTTQKYKTSADIANEVMKSVIESIAPGKKIVESCALGDDLIQKKTQNVYGKGKIKMERGIAFPTCISINNCVGHFSPNNDNESVFTEGDLVKIDLGVHVDGYSALAAQTIIVGTSTNSKAADVISAAYYASEAALRLLKKGKSNQEITAVIEKIATIYNCKPVQGVLSHQINRFQIDGEKVILNKTDIDHAVDDFIFEEGQVFCIDIVMTTGEGKTRVEEDKCTIYKRNGTTVYDLKLKSSRAVFGEIGKRYPSFPFSVRNLEDQKNRHGVLECAKHDLLHTLPVLYEREGQLVSQFKFTALITPNGTQKITNTFLPELKSEFSIEDPQIKELLNQSTKKSKPKKKKTDGKETETETEEKTEESEQ